MPLVYLMVVAAVLGLTMGFGPTSPSEPAPGMWLALLGCAGLLAMVAQW